jgi:hypothetical protein
LCIAAATPAAEPSLSFQYTIEGEGSDAQAAFLKGFEKEGLRLKVKLNQESYCYVILSGKNGMYQLVFPNADTLKGGGLPVGVWARIPKVTFVRMGENPGTERVYIIVAAQRVPELDEAAAKGETSLSETTALGIRDRYQGKGVYTRGQDGRTVSIKYRPNPGDASSLVEEIVVQAALQAIEPKRPDSK